MYYIIIGATCAGKDKIASYIIDNYKGFKMIISTTSRPIRPKESNGVEYYFVSREDFKRMLDNGEFIEYRTYNTFVNGVKDIWYYGLEKKNVGDTSTNYVAVMDYQGATEFMEYVGREKVVLIYVKSPYRERYVRNVLRGDFNINEWTRRNKDDLKWLNNAYKNADSVVLNYGFNFPEIPTESIDLNTDIEYSPIPPNFEMTKKQIDHVIRDCENIVRSHKKEAE